MRGGIDSALLALGQASIAGLGPADLLVPPGFTRTASGPGRPVQASPGRRD
jgi:pre-mycofactocin synthase